MFDHVIIADPTRANVVDFQALHLFGPYGVSEPTELHKLKDVDVYAIDLKYGSDDYVEYGNAFKFVSKIWDQAGGGHNTCFDVFLQIGS